MIFSMAFCSSDGWSVDSDLTIIAMIGSICDSQATQAFSLCLAI